MDCNYKSLDLTEFINQYAQDQKIDARKYCFILGAGASKQSGIPTGAELANKWLKEIEEKYNGQNFDRWKTEIELVDGREAEKYSKIYEKRFEINPKEGYLFLEKQMKNIEPSFGYSILAQILEKTNDKIVITTNFDSLIEDAMFIYTTERPLTLGHESLAGYVNILSKRPIIAKIHRDLLLSPKNRENEIQSLEKAWEENLAAIFKYYTPMVIGYGGNDDSLMEFLENQAKPTTGMFWFYWEGNDNDKEKYIPNERILKLVNNYNGFIIPIKGFDEMMLEINNALNYELIGDKLKTIAEKRTKTYEEQLHKLGGSKNTSSSVKDMLLNAPRKEDKNWWTIQIEIDNEEDIEKKNQMYIEGIREIHNSRELIGNYALFLENILKDYVKAERYYLKAIKIDPNDANNLGNYAGFLEDRKKDYTKAKEYYLRAIQIEPKNANNIGNYAKLKIEEENYQEAKDLIQEAFNLHAEEDDLLIELWFYRYAIYKEWYEESEAKLEELLGKKIKSIGWDFDGVIEKAKKLGHKNIDKLIEFKDRITKE